MSAQDEEQAIHLLNEVKLETDGNAKVDKLKALYELVVNKEPGLLDTFLPEVVELQVDPAPQVRKYLSELLAGAAKARPTAQVLLQCIQCVSGLLGDDIVAAVKQAVLMCNLFFRTALSLVVAQGADPQHVAQLRPLWEAAEGLKAAIASMAMQHKNDGVRMNAAKFIEQAILLLTADTIPGLPGAGTADLRLQAGNQVADKEEKEEVVTKSALVKDAEGLLSQLVALLKLRLGEDLAGPVAIVVVKSAGAVAQHRLQFLGKVLPPLLSLANSGAYKVDAGESGMQSSIANALKGALAGVLRCTDPKAAPWHKKVVDAMHAMGAGALADSTVKQVHRVNKRSSSEEPEGAKRVRVEASIQQHRQPPQEPSGQPLPMQQPPGQPLAVQQPPQLPLGQPVPMEAEQAPGQPAFAMQQQHQQGPLFPTAGTPPLPAPALPPPTSEADLQRVLTVVRALVGQGNAAMLATIVGGLQPVVLADLVLALLFTLPQRHVLLPDHLPLEPWAQQLLHLLEPDSAALPLPALAQQLQQLAVVPPPLQQPYLHQPQPQPVLPLTGQQLGPPIVTQLAQQQQQFALGLPTPELGGPGGVPPGLGPPGGGPPLQPAMQPTGLSHPGPPPSGPQMVSAQMVPAAGALPGRQPTPPPAQQQQHEQQQRRQREEPPAPTVAAPPQLPKAVPRPPPVPSFQLAPLPLTPQQQSGMRRAAVLRILSSRQVASPALQRALVARLAASSSAAGADGLGDAVLQYLLEDFAGRGGFELCMQWLNILFAAECKPIAVGESGDGSGAGAPGLDAASLAEFVNSGLDSFGIEGFLGVKAEEPQYSPSIAAAGESRPASPADSNAPAASGGAGGAGGEGGHYQVVLLALLEGLRDALPPSDKTIIRVLLEVPALPMPPIRHFLRDLCNSGPDWATLALLAARDVIDQCPPSRQQVLGFVLEAASDPTPDVRSKAVRLTANRLFPQPAVTAAIERHARQQLDSMLVWRPRPASAASSRPSASPFEGASDAEAKDSAAAAGAGQAGAPSSRQVLPSEQYEAGSGGAGPGSSAVKAEDEKEAAEGQGPDGPDEATAAQLCALYCALCTKKHALLRHLFEVYGSTSDGGRAAIHRNAPGLAKTLGASAAALLAVVQDPPEGSLNLVVNMLYVLAEAAPPPPALVAAGRQLFSRCHDARVLPPLLPAMDKAAVLRLLPALLCLPGEAFTEAARRLVRPPPGGGGLGPLFQPSELLVALHMLDHSADPGLLRKMMAGVSTCIAARDLFGHEALAATISQLLTRAPLPQLFMRTVIQSLAAARQLRSFVVRTLSQLVTRQVWNDATQWKGWLMAAQQAAPESFPAWLQLPTAVLGRALQGLPEPFKRQLAAHAASPQCTQAVPRATMDLLRPYLPKEEEGTAEEKC